MVTKDAVWQVLKTIDFPGFAGKNVLGIVKELRIEPPGDIYIELAIDHFGKNTQQQIVDAIGPKLEALPGVGTIYFSIIPMPGMTPAPPTTRRGAIGTVIAVGSGKGGVGKSTLTVNLAVGLAQAGLRVGLMDADVFGPNVPRMLGVYELPPSPVKGMLEPAQAHGIRFVSVGLLTEANQAVVWRGPMLDKILHQFMEGVSWGELDVLLVDLPPGTGDIPLSLAKRAEPDGAIVVVTPQEVALDDARKAITMFRRLTIPVLGLVENMSYFICDTCDARHYLFGEGGGARLAAEADVTLLGEIPFTPQVGQGNDSGVPTVLQGETPTVQALREVIEHIKGRIAKMSIKDSASPFKELNSQVDNES